MRTISILIGEGSRMAGELLSDALRRLSSDYEIVGCSTTSNEILEGVRRTNPAVTLISHDLAEGRGAGLALLRELHLQSPERRTILLLERSEAEVTMEAFRSGARGLIARSEPLATLSRCIMAVHQGQVWANSRELQYLLEGFSRTSRAHLVNTKGEVLLTRREEELVALVAEGMTNRVISQKLNISEHTVKNYLFRIYDKIGVSNRAELILYTISQQNRRARGDAA